MYTYEQSTGRWLKDGKLIGVGGEETSVIEHS